MELILIFFLNTAFERHAQSARAVGLAHALTASCRSIDAIRVNPAWLSFVTQNHAAAGYERALGGIEGLHNIALGYARPLFWGGFGIQLSEFGFSEQKEQAVTIAYGSSFNETFSFGLASDLYIIDNERTGQTYAFGLSFGLLGRIYKKWSLGVYGHNLNRPQFGLSDEGELPAELKAGLSYEPFEDILSEIDLSMKDDDMRVHLGAEFRLFGLLYLRSGIKTNPSVVAAGTGIVYKFISFDYAAEFVPDLPLSHTATLGFTF